MPAVCCASWLMSDAERGLVTDPKCREQQNCLADIPAPLLPHVASIRLEKVHHTPWSLA